VPQAKRVYLALQLAACRQAAQAGPAAASAAPWPARAVLCTPPAKAVGPLQPSPCVNQHLTQKVAHESIDPWKDKSRLDSPLRWRETPKYTW
jgi:hypothetical protein